MPELKGLQQYVLKVATKEFSQPENWFTIKEDEYEELLRLLEE